MVKLLRNLLILIPILLWTIWPVILVAIAGAIASTNGCELNETVINSCIVNGREMGNTLYSMGVMGWFMLVTIPTGLLALLILLLLLLIEWIVGRARAKRRLAAQSAVQPVQMPVTPDSDSSD